MSLLDPNVEYLPPEPGAPDDERYVEEAAKDDRTRAADQGRSPFATPSSTQIRVSFPFCTESGQRCGVTTPM